MQVPRDRIFPSSTDLERAVLGACFIGDKELCADVYERLGGGVALYNSHHKKILDAIMSVCYDGFDPDIISVVEALKKSGGLEEVGGIPAVASLSSEMATTSNVPYHCNLVVDDYNLRRFITHQTNLINKAYDRSEVPNDLYEASQSLEIDLSIDNDMETMSDIVTRAATEVEEAMQDPNAHKGVPTGLRCLDRLLGGWQQEELVYIAARPSVGKTALALYSANAAQAPVFFVSVEMSKRMVSMRLLAAETGIPSHQLKIGNLNGEEYERLKAAEIRLRSSQIIIDDKIRTPSLIVTESKRLKSTHGIKAVFVDYLQLLDPPRTEKDANREREVSKMSKMMKNLSKDTGLPTIVLAQLNRNVEYTSRRPQKSDLRDSGSLEQDADVVIFIHPVKETQDIVEIIVDKNRNGPTGIYRVRFTKETGTFTSLDG